MKSTIELASNFGQETMDNKETMNNK